MVENIIGIDLGGTSVKMALLDTDGNIKKQWSIPTNVTDSGSHILNEIVNSIKKFCSENNLHLDDIKGIGMGSPGKVNVNRGTVVGAFNLGWKNEVNVKDFFEKKLKKPFFIENDANLAALGEMWKGAGFNSQNIVLVTLGTGVGGGIIINGNLVHGNSGSAGEIGHMYVGDDTYLCSCGNYGCLETVASATGILNLARDISKNESKNSDTKDRITQNSCSVKEIFEIAKNGDELAILIVKKFGEYLGKSLSQLGNALNPDFIILGGGVSNAGDYLLGIVDKEFKKHVFPGIKENTKIVLATLGNDAGIIGASKLVQ